MPVTLTIKGRHGEWWIHGDPETGPWGPYDDKDEAIKVRKGVLDFEKYGDRPGFVTTDKRPCRNGENQVSSPR